MWILLFAAYAVAVPSMLVIDTVQSLVNVLDRKPATHATNTTSRS